MNRWGKRRKVRGKRKMRKKRKRVRRRRRRRGGGGRGGGRGEEGSKNFALTGSLQALHCTSTASGVKDSGEEALADVTPQYQAPASSLTPAVRAECRGRFLAALCHVISLPSLAYVAPGTAGSTSNSKEASLWAFKADVVQSLLGAASFLESSEGARLAHPLTDGVRRLLQKVLRTMKALARFEAEPPALFRQ